VLAPKRKVTRLQQAALGPQLDGEAAVVEELVINSFEAPSLRS
jgi:hypothetical protein